MTLGIMQPYLFPYIGYWQLISAVDTFVVYDDVNFIKQGYINKNNILSNGAAHPFTLELVGTSSNKLINKIKIGNNKKKLLKTIKQNYIKAPYFNTIFPLIEDIFKQNEENLAKFIGYSIIKVSAYLNLDTKIIFSSEIEKDNNLKGQEKVIHICKKLDAKNYINAIGGRELYSKAVFERSNLVLNFLNTEFIEYTQYENEFVPYLSIIDILMFNNLEIISQQLKNYKLI